MKLVIHNSSRVWGGNEKWLAFVAEGLQARGHRVVVSCHAEGPVRERLEARGIPTTRVRLGGELDLPRIARFTRWLRRERPDAVLLTSWTRTPWAAWAARRAGVARVVVRLGIVRDAPRRGRYARAFRKRVDALIVNSREIRARWLRTAPWFPAGEVHVILNGIRPPGPGAGPEREALRRSLGLRRDARMVAGVGHVTHRKGFDLAIDALARLDPGVHLVVVGSGPEEEALRRRAEGLGVAARVHWLGFRDDVTELLRACDLFVLSSRNEGMANVMLEAMAVGTPVVATAVSGVEEALGERAGAPPAGWIVPPDEVEAMARAMAEALAAPPDARASRVAEARRRIEREFGVDRMVGEVERVLFPEAGA